jgi:hypothetical protein
MQAQYKVRVMKAETEYSELYSRMLKNIAEISFSAFELEFYFFICFVEYIRRTLFILSRIEISGRFLLLLTNIICFSRTI